MQKETLTVESLARALYKEFDRDNWGDIDPYLFKKVVKQDDDVDYCDVLGVREVLKRVVARFS